MYEASCWRCDVFMTPHRARRAARVWGQTRRALVAWETALPRVAAKRAGEWGVQPVRARDADLGNMPMP
jgi:hypothetical protein